MHVTDACRFLRTAIISKACAYGMEACVSKARELFKLWQSKPERNPVNANLRAVMLCNGVRYGDWDDWLWLYRHFKSTNIAGERTMYLSAFACSREVWILQQ